MLNLERGDGRPAGLLFVYLALILTSYTLARSVRDAMFLDQFSALELPLIYVALAVVIGLIVFVYIRLSRRIDQRQLIGATLVLSALSVGLLWWGMIVRSSAIAVVFYFWTNVFGALLTSQVWSVANTVLDVRQARRLFPLVTSGAILGSMAGGGAAAGLVRHLGTANLILILIPLLLMALGLLRLLVPRGEPPAASSPRSTPERAESRVLAGGGWKAVSSSRHLKLVAGLVAVSAVVTLLVDFQFKTVVERSIGSRDEMTAFFGSFYVYLGALSLPLQFLAGAKVVERYGVRAALLILPLALMAGLALLLVFPMRLWAAAVLKGSDTMMRHSIDRSALELLYLPVSGSVRAEAKAVIDVVVQRMADGVGGVLLLVLTRALGFGVSGTAVVGLALLGLWLWLALEARQEYVRALRSRLAERPALPKSTLRMVFGDQGSLATLQLMLKSKEEDVVLYAIDLAAALGKKEWIPASLTSHPSPRVRRRAVELLPLAHRDLLEQLCTDSDLTVRSTAVTRILEGQPMISPEVGLSELVRSTDVRVRLAALAYLSRRAGRDEAGMLRTHLERLVKGLQEDAPEWREIARGLGEMAHPAAADLHLKLLRHPDAEVRRLAILSAGRAGHRELVPHLVALLADRRFAREARRALTEFGPRILGSMADLLRDPTEDLEVRRAIPLVLAYMPHQGAVDLLLESLFDYDGLLRYRAIRALGKLRLIDPDLHFDADKVILRVREECEQTLWYQDALEALYPHGDSTDLLAQLLRDKVARGRERVFRLLGLLLPPTAACASFLAMVENDHYLKASAAEYLEHALPGKLKDLVLPLIEPGRSVFGRGREIRTVLTTCLHSPDPVLRECTADAVGRGRWPEEFPRRPGAPPPSTMEVRANG